MRQIDKLEADIKNIIAYSFRDDDMLVKSLCFYIGERVKTAVQNDRKKQEERDLAKQINEVKK